MHSSTLCNSGGPVQSQFERLEDGGAEGIRTPDPHNAIVVLYQLSYDPIQSDAQSKFPFASVKGFPTDMGMQFAIWWGERPREPSSYRCIAQAREDARSTKPPLRNHIALEL